MSDPQETLAECEVLLTKAARLFGKLEARQWTSEGLDAKQGLGTLLSETLSAVSRALHPEKYTESESEPGAESESGPEAEELAVDEPPPAEPKPELF